MRRLLLLCSVLASLPVTAQTRALSHADPSRGATLPPTSAALADEAITALGANPAGLSHLDALQLFYLHERSVGRNELVDGLYLGNTIFDAVGVGFGVEWVRSTSAPGLRGRAERRRTSWGLSLGSDVLSAGATFGFFSSSEDATLDEAMAFDLGLMARPWPFLSVGATARNLNHPGTSAATLPRSWELSLGVRPFGERFTLGAGYGFEEARGLRAGALSWVLQAEVMQGLVLGAGVSHGLGGAGAPGLAFQLSLAFNLSSVGVTWATGSSGGELSHAVQARISAAEYPGFSTGGGDVALIDVAQALGDGGSGPLSLLEASETDAFLALIRLLHQAERDPDLRAVIVKLELLPEVGLGKAEELRQALLRLRKAGKKVLSVIFTGGDTEYLVASASDRILLVPQSMLMVNGLSSSVTFLGGAMEKLGVTWDVARVGAYKNAPDTFTRKDMSDEQQESIAATLDADLRHLEAAIAQGRNLTVEKVREILNEGVLPAKRAQALGLVDGVIDPAQLDKEVAALVPGAGFSGDYALFDREERRWGRSPKLAVIPVVGTIASGPSREDPLGFAEVAGAETVIRALTEASGDPDVAAIVLRVDSGGGDGLASDLMYRAVLEAKEKKPVIASMGDVAASGGYYAAMGADRIFAPPTAVTGSIGVFMLKPALGPALERVGIRTETLRRGELSTLFSTAQPWTPTERAAAQKWVDAFYDDFITGVATSRSLKKEQVDQVARGRVWSAAAAKDLGLVDELGSLQDAIDFARRKAGIADGEPYELALYGRPQGPLSGLGAGLVEAGLLEAPPSAREDLRPLVEGLGLPPSVVFQPGVKALLPFRWVIQ